jgi:hypothetical protein
MNALARPKSYSQPTPIAAGDLIELGSWRGSRWFSHPRHGDLREGPTVDGFGILPSSLVIEFIDGSDRYWRTFEAFEAGTFETLAADTPRPPRPAKPHRPIDALSLAWLADRHPERIFAAAPRPGPIGPIGRGSPIDIRPGEPPARGAEAIIARLARSGTEVRLAADRRHIVVTAPGGRPGPGVVELVNLAERLLVGHLLGGAPVACEVTAHPTPVPAVTVLLGGALACADCLEFVEMADVA